MITQNISKMKSSKLLLAIAACAISVSSFAQVKIGDNPTTINGGSVLELESTNKGLLMPRISLTNTTTWGLAGTSAAGMHVFNTNTGITSTNTTYPTLAAKIGEYYWDGTGWVALAPLVKSTAIYSFPQTTGVKIALPNSGGVGTCGGLACATYLNWQGTFTTSQSLNDVILDVTGTYSVALNTTAVNFNFFVAIDKTTPGVMEQVDNFFVTNAGTACNADDFNYKTVLQNLPPRTYNVRVYAAPWVNNGAVAQLGIGQQSNPGGCGTNLPAGQSLIITVSQ